MAERSGDPASTEAMRAYWDSKAKENASYYIHSQLKYQNPDMDEFWASGIENLDRTLEPFDVSFTGDERAVDIGCGIGRMTRALSLRVGSVVGVDVSDEMVRRAGEELRQQGVGNAEVMLGNGHDLTGLDSDTFDVAYSFIVFQHIPDADVTCSYIREIGRVLRSGGWTVFQISDEPSIHERETYASGVSLKDRVKGWLGRAPHGTLEPQWLGSSVPRQKLLQALDAGGLELVKTIGDGTQFCFVHAVKR